MILVLISLHSHLSLSFSLSLSFPRRIPCRFQPFSLFPLVLLFVLFDLLSLYGAWKLLVLLLPVLLTSGVVPTPPTPGCQPDSILSYHPHSLTRLRSLCSRTRLVFRSRYTPTIQFLDSSRPRSSVELRSTFYRGQAPCDAHPNRLFPFLRVTHHHPKSTYLRSLLRLSAPSNLFFPAHRDKPNTSPPPRRLRGGVNLIHHGACPCAS